MKQSAILVGVSGGWFFEIHCLAVFGSGNSVHDTVQRERRLRGLMLSAEHPNGR